MWKVSLTSSQPDITAAPPRFRFGGILGGRPRMGSEGRRNPRIAKKFWKFSKDLLRKLQQMHYFRRFFKKFKNPELNFRAFGGKNTSFGKFLRKFWKFSKFWKISYENSKERTTLAYFSTKIEKTWVKFSRVWTKNANCWQILRKFSKFLMKIL